MSPMILAWVQSWSEIKADFEVDWLIYLSMPFIAAFVGYTTKIVALQMLYRPLEFEGIGWFGWQGVVPRRAGKTAAVTIQMLTEKLLRPEEILERIDAKAAVEELRGPLTAPSTRWPASWPRRSAPVSGTPCPRRAARSSGPGSRPSLPRWSTTSSRR